MNSETIRLQEAVAQNEAILKAIAKDNAQKCVDRAIARGVIPARNETLKADWLQLCEEDPAKIELLDGCLGNSVLTAGRITKPAKR